MNNTLHTPGPWHLNGNGILLHPVTNAQLVTQRIETSLGSFEILDETNEPEGNARLISAAPDLLSALQQMLNADYAIQEGFGEKSDQAMMRISAIDSAHRAIAKAKGEA